VHEYEFSFEIEGTPQEIWDVFLEHHRKGVQTKAVQVEILTPGDEAANGMVRHVSYPAPRYLLSGGRAQSWEWITEAVAPVSWRNDAVFKPPFGVATGWTRLEDLGNGRTRLHFREQVDVHNPVVDLVIGRNLARSIARDNRTHYEQGIPVWLRDKRANP
jgi:hypothetical protein